MKPYSDITKGTKPIKLSDFLDFKKYPRTGGNLKDYKKIIKNDK